MSGEVVDGIGSGGTAGTGAPSGGGRASGTGSVKGVCAAARTLTRSRGAGMRAAVPYHLRSEDCRPRDLRICRQP